MKLGRSTICAISVAALSIGAAFAGEDSTHRWHSTGSDWQERAPLAAFNDADSQPENVSDPMVIGNEPMPAHESDVVIEQSGPMSYYSDPYPDYSPDSLIVPN
jgi:hypothetical protein